MVLKYQLGDGDNLTQSVLGLWVNSLDNILRDDLRTTDSILQGVSLKFELSDGRAFNVLIVIELVGLTLLLALGDLQLNKKRSIAFQITNVFLLFGLANGGLLEFTLTKTLQASELLVGVWLEAIITKFGFNST